MALLNRNTNDDLRRSTQENIYEFLPVPENQIGLIIGRKGRTIIQIQETSGAKLSDQSQRGRSGFAIRGNERQRARARELIHEKLVSKWNYFCHRNSSDFPIYLDWNSFECSESDCQSVT